MKAQIGEVHEDVTKLEGRLDSMQASFLAEQETANEGILLLCRYVLPIYSCFSYLFFLFFQACLVSTVCLDMPQYMPKYLSREVVGPGQHAGQLPGRAGNRERGHPAAVQVHKSDCPTAIVLVPGLPCGPDFVSGCFRGWNWCLGQLPGRAGNRQ